MPARSKATTAAPVSAFFNVSCMTLSSLGRLDAESVRSRLEPGGTSASQGQASRRERFPQIFPKAVHAGRVASCPGCAPESDLVLSVQKLALFGQMTRSTFCLFYLRVP